MASPTSTKPTTALQGRFLWYELHTTDLKAATEFYRKIIGWTAKQSDMVTDMQYTILSVGDNQVGGMMELSAEMRQYKVPPHWMGYIGCDDVDETIARARKLGATVHFGPHDIPNVGRFAAIGDPQGAAIALLTPAYDPGPESDPEIGQVAWHELLTTDYKAAWKFYQELFGWEEMQSMDMGEGLGVYFMFGRNGKMLGGMWNKTPDMPMPPNWCYYVRTKDTKAAVPVIEKSGGKILNGPMEVPGGDWVAQGIDPQGAVFAISSKP
jgi:predicted enzyme related to lactoylglutathione lyase